VPLLFAVTLFVSASLLFMVQPMVGKMVLPLLGGSPAVWNACMVFFQALLLLGYIYAHWLSTRFAPRRQWPLHLLVLMLPVAAMGLAVALGPRHAPIAIVERLAPSGEGSSPVLSVLAILAIAIGIPFFVASTSAPLLQKWFAFTGHPSARDPYFLYAASNAGSLISLLGYPLFIEPYLSPPGQAWLFAGGFVLLVGVIFVCGRAAANPIGVPPPQRPIGGKPPTAGGAGEAGGPAVAVVRHEPPPTWPRRLKWVTLAFVPSSLMLGVTFHMTTDIASIPLLWVIPLALYLITFIVAFSNTSIFSWIGDLFAAGGRPAAAAVRSARTDTFRMVLGNLAPVMILLLVFLMISRVSPGTGIELLLYLATFYAVALMCHYELARDRPSPQYLTEYFIWMSVGGVLGGLFNSIIAPLVFPLAYEFPLALVIACLLVPRLTDEPEPPKVVAAKAGVAVAATTEADASDLWAGGLGAGLFRRFLKRADRDARTALVLDIVFPVLVGVAFWLLTTMPDRVWFVELVKSIALSLTISAQTVLAILVYAIPVMACFFFVDRPLRFALSVAAILGVHYFKERDREIIHTDRSFFGILKVEEYAQYVRLVHGTTLHGTQIREYYLLKADSPIPFGSFSPWDVVLLEGAIKAWDPTQEPLTYYHRTGPVGAMFRELRTRKGGAEAKSHVAMVGLGTGSVSCYALPGQKLTFYEIDPAVRRIVEEPWKVMNPDEVKKGAEPALGPFTFVKDARNRGAEIDFRMGDARLVLDKDRDRKYTLLLVDAFSSDAIPVHLLTKEAVQMYLDRMTDDGILALHISNKYVRLEPVVAKIAEELGLTALVWNDDGERRPGKTPSSWCVLARKPEHLGGLYSPVGELVRDLEYSPHVQIQHALLVVYGDEFRPVMEKAKTNEEFKAAAAAWLEDRRVRHNDPRAAVYARLVEKYDPTTQLDDAMLAESGHVFRPVRVLDEVPAWTDDYSDVLRVIMIPEVQKIRKFFGLPTPVER
jgi:hypothetical protein